MTTSQIGEVQNGEQAVITPSGATTSVYGVVSSFSSQGTTSSGVTSFPVVVSVTGAPSGLYPGASATVELVVKQVSNVLVVPTSAVHTLGSSSYVEVLKNGKEQRQVIGVGATGAAETQVTSGLSSGEEVVLASLGSAASSSGSSSRFGGLGGGLGGGFGGGFGGGLGGAGGFTRSGRAGG